LRALLEKINHWCKHFTDAHGETERSMLREQNEQLRQQIDLLTFENAVIRVKVLNELLHHATVGSSIDPARLSLSATHLPQLLPAQVLDVQLPLRDIIGFEKTKTTDNTFLYQIIAHDIITNRIIRYACESAIDVGGDAVMSGVIAEQLIDGLRGTLRDIAIAEFLKSARKTQSL
jgi:hypothetical protein